MRYVSVQKLSKILGLLIEKLENEGYTGIAIESDLYRYIPTEKWDSFETDEIDTGSLSDDIDSLELLLTDPDRPTTYVDFDRVASVLRAISQTNNPV